ncbi:DUF2180 family protein [Streptomyces formicae]|uniref:DUF2180 family protein n=1 Tax=Streptomyces formicae TaxID=1616117 RepID=A0A291QCY6_9ACTN|nr:DUF2180 family protein [Streptomyces formicae]ATL29344.1 hypothetical protein KY5_4326 [Streptomyces formicae]
MNCYDCHTQERPGIPAVAICHRCGAGLCPDHAHATPTTLHRVHGTGLATGPRPARRITCHTCRAAEAQSDTGRVAVLPETVGHPGT